MPPTVKCAPASTLPVVPPLPLEPLLALELPLPVDPELPVEALLEPEEMELPLLEARLEVPLDELLVLELADDVVLLDVDAPADEP